jgi:hypothetical protein
VRVGVDQLADRQAVGMLGVTHRGDGAANSRRSNPGFP